MFGFRWHKHSGTTDQNKSIVCMFASFFLSSCLCLSASYSHCRVAGCSSIDFKFTMHWTPILQRSWLHPYCCSSSASQIHAIPRYPASRPTICVHGFLCVCVYLVCVYSSLLPQSHIFQSADWSHSPPAGSLPRPWYTVSLYTYKQLLIG